MERIRIETGARAASAAGGRAWTTSTSETWPAEYISYSSEARARYQSLDVKVTGELRFNGAPTIGMGTTRFVWVTSGHPKYLKILWPVMAADNVDGAERLTTIVVEDRGDVADE